MLRRIETPENIPDFIEGVKAGDERLMGFGHRVYKNYDPRATIIKKACEDVFEVTGRNPLLDIATELEKIALEDDYFISRKLYPNVDFYSGLIYEALGLPVEMFPVMFAIGRTSGWIAQWLEMLDDKEQKIARPRQIYTGARDARLRADAAARIAPDASPPSSSEQPVAAVCGLTVGWPNPRSVAGMEMRLMDGTELVIRRIRPADKLRLSAALTRLSDESTRSRFLAPKPRFTSAELRYLTEVDFSDHFAIVAVLRDRPGVIVGVARWVRDRTSRRRRRWRSRSPITFRARASGAGWA